MVDIPASPPRTLRWSRIAVYSLIILGSVLNLLFIVPNGHITCIDEVCGIRIGEWHYHDALWHIAVARNSFATFPFTFPSASGFELTAYNYLLGFILFLFEHIRLDPFLVYFKLLPIVGNICIIYTLMRYFRLTHKTHIQQVWIAFFLYFGSSLSYLLIWYRGSLAEYSILKGFPVVATLQPALVLSNVQFFLTIPILLYVFTNQIIRDTSWRTTLIHGALLSLAIGLKIYSGVFVGLMLGIGLLAQAIKIHYLKRTVLMGTFFFVIALVSMYVFYLPLGAHSTSFPLLWAPFAIPHVITESPGLFYHKDFTLGRYFMYGLGNISMRLIAYEGISTLLFILWNLGSRFIVFIVVPLLIVQKSLTKEHGILFLLGCVGLMVPVLFIQFGGGWYNTIQFAYVGVYFLSILAGLCVSWISQRPWVMSRIIILCIVIITIPNNVLLFSLLAKDKILISSQELRILHYLKNAPSGTVLSFPDDKNSSYVPALSAQTGYMIDYEQARLLDLPVEDRIKNVEQRDCAVLAEVKYVYLSSSRGEEYIHCPSFSSRFRLLQESGKIRLYGVQ